MENNKFFVISSSCKLVKGANRSIIVDYLRNDVRIIPNTYYDLTDLMDRKPLEEVLGMIDSASVDSFYDFLNFMLSNEYGFLLDNPENFPQISNKVHDDHVILKDCIIEIDPTEFENEIFNESLFQLNNLSCDDLQIRFLGSVEMDFVNHILNEINLYDFNCVELHIRYGAKMKRNICFDIIENFAPISNIYLYNSKQTEKDECLINREGHAGLLMGNIISIEDDLNSNSCGVINKESLSFTDIDLHNLITEYNGCLYKKLTINTRGDIKNCPYMVKEYGNILQNNLDVILNDPEFRNYWFIKKDEIDICKDCEFRYNCTDCRAFVENDDLKGKPLKCGYDPYTNKWEEWSNSPLKVYDQVD
ncbi:MAG: grasp-with-spasm system SPASM domain peptide maturase [Salegentibacter mishustinae]|nr:grasp-with-spasm system SPASM domain peptide maturase [Salegentibacter mishustinae]